MTTPTNVYYQRRFDATGGQLARAKQMVTEFRLIQRGFDLIGLQNSVIKYQLSCSDLVSPLTAGPARAYFRTTDAFNLLEVRASLLQASESGAVRLNVIINGFSALYQQIQIDQGERTSLTSSVPPSIAYVAIPDDSEVVIDILTAGLNAKGLICSFIGVRTGSLPEDIV